MPTLLLKQNKNNWYATTCDTLIILCSSNISHSLTFPKPSGKRPKRLKILKLAAKILDT